MTPDLVGSVAPASSKDKGDTQLLKNLAEVHQKFGIHGTAIDLLGLSLWIDKDDNEALVLLARSLFRCQDFSQTLRCLQRIEDIGGTLSETQEMMRVSALALNGQTEDANRLLESNLIQMEDFE